MSLHPSCLFVDGSPPSDFVGSEKAPAWFMLDGAVKLVGVSTYGTSSPVYRKNMSLKLSFYHFQSGITIALPPVHHQGETSLLVFGDPDATCSSYGASSLMSKSSNLNSSNPVCEAPSWMSLMTSGIDVVVVVSEVNLSLQQKFNDMKLLQIAFSAFSSFLKQQRLVLLIQLRSTKPSLDRTKTQQLTALSSCFQNSLDSITSERNFFEASDVKKSPYMTMTGHATSGNFNDVCSLVLGSMIHFIASAEKRYGFLSLMYPSVAAARDPCGLQLKSSINAFAELDHKNFLQSLNTTLQLWLSPSILEDTKKLVVLLCDVIPRKVMSCSDDP